MFDIICFMWRHYFIWNKEKSTVVLNHVHADWFVSKFLELLLCRIPASSRSVFCEAHGSLHDAACWLKTFFHFFFRTVFLFILFSHTCILSPDLIGYFMEIIGNFSNTGFLSIIAAYETLCKKKGTRNFRQVMIFLQWWNHYLHYNYEVPIEKKLLHWKERYCNSRRSNSTKYKKKKKRKETGIASVKSYMTLTKIRKL